MLLLTVPRRQAHPLIEGERLRIAKDWGTIIYCIRSTARKMTASTSVQRSNLLFSRFRSLVALSALVGNNMHLRGLSFRYV